MVRVSTMEQFRRWLADEEAGEFNPDIPETEAMRAGTAFHKALENAPAGDFETLEALGYTFTFECDVALVLPSIREIRGYKQYGPLSITGQVDCIEGNRVEDHKTTAYPNLERFLEGMQWRYYLDIFGADVFRWNVFTIKPKTTDEGCRDYLVTGLDTLEQVRYAGLHKDCAALAEEYCRHFMERKAA